VVVSLHLSPRQVEVCILIAGGESEKGTARELGITRETVKMHLRAGSLRIVVFMPWLKGKQHRQVVRDWYRECVRLAYHTHRQAA
jgi:FixJ family two-component response regulator